MKIFLAANLYIEKYDLNCRNLSYQFTNLAVWNWNGEIEYMCGTCQCRLSITKRIKIYEQSFDVAVANLSCYSSLSKCNVRIACIIFYTYATNHNLKCFMTNCFIRGISFKGIYIY